MQIAPHQVQLPLTQAHLTPNLQLGPAFGQVHINQAQLANIATIHPHPSAGHAYFTPSISLQQVLVRILPRFFVSHLWVV